MFSRQKRGTKIEMTNYRNKGLDKITLSFILQMLEVIKLIIQK